MIQSSRLMFNTPPPQMPMKNVLQRIAHMGATFTNAFTSSPICCPSRASILSGQFAHNCATINNSLAGGCYGDFWRKHVEQRTIAAVADSIGMETFFAGKYMNQVGTQLKLYTWQLTQTDCLLYYIFSPAVPWRVSAAQVGPVLRPGGQLEVLQLFPERER